MQFNMQFNMQIWTLSPGGGFMASQYIFEYYYDASSYPTFEIPR